MVACFLTSRLGCRLTCILGGIIAAGGYFVSLTSSNVYVLYVNLGVLPGIGLSLPMFVSIVCLNQYFVKLRPLVVAIALSGLGAGVFVFPVMTAYFLDTYGIKGTCLLLGGLALNIVWCGLIFRPVTTTLGEFPVLEDKSENEKSISCNRREENDTNTFSMVKTIVYLFTVFVQSVSFNIYQMFIVQFVAQAIPGLTPEQPAFVLSGSGITSIVGRLVIGGLCTLRPEMTIPVKAFALCLCGILSFAVTICKTYLTMFVTVCFQGLVIGGYGCLQYVVLVRLVGMKRFPRFMGLLLLQQGGGAIIGPPTAVWLRTVTKLREIPFFIAGACFVLSGISLIPLSLVGPRGNGTKLEHVQEVRKGQPSDAIATITKLHHDDYPFR
ncbi:monocarboxylate transporter 3-like [Gigantopelta aegis]|uniref:monocarboxylate transporter 3-like n=1 Tax=Gigantopelta aegis TaxID=1735272 RepID=UPI001B88A234|nr:monocarboxylate transporter 3-like [Gigantopelta aegis]